LAPIISAGSYAFMFHGPGPSGQALVSVSGSMMTSNPGQVTLALQDQYQDPVSHQWVTQTFTVHPFTFPSLNEYQTVGWTELISLRPGVDHSIYVEWASGGYADPEVYSTDASWYITVYSP